MNTTKRDSKSKSFTKNIQTPAAIFTLLCAAATALGSLLTWIDASGLRPMLGVNHTSLSHMLVYTFADGDPFVKSVGCAILLLGVLMALGAVLGLRPLTAVAALLAIAAGGMWIGLVAHVFDTPNLPNLHYVNPANLPWSSLRTGAWLTLGGSTLGLLSTLLPRRK